METCLKADEGTLRELGDNAQRAVLEQHHILTEAGKLAALFTTLLRPEQTAGGKAP